MNVEERGQQKEHVLDVNVGEGSDKRNMCLM